MTDNDDEVYDLTDRGDDRPGLEDADVDDPDDVEDDDDEYDDLEDASPEEVDCVVAMWREDGAPMAGALAKDLANDLEELIEALRRIPGDAGALGAVSISGEFFVLCRVRGAAVQVLLSDSLAAQDYPIARDVLDFLDEDDVDDEEDEGEPVGDLDMLADLGVGEFDLEQIAGNYDDASDELLAQIAQRLSMGPQFAAAAR